LEDRAERQQARFDRLMGTYHDLPDARFTKPATVMQTVPILNETTTAVVQTLKSADDGFTIFVQVVDSTGHQRIVLPDKVAMAIYRQRDRLMDRSTPESRARKRAAAERARKREEKARRSAEWRRKNPDGGPLARARAKR
jgi:hypothetical protein